MKVCILFMLLLMSTAAYCQAVQTDVPEKTATSSVETAIPPSASPPGKVAQYNYFIEKAEGAFATGDLEKCRYYLDQSEQRNYVNERFYLLLGKWHYAKKDYSGAEHFWMRGYKKRGCWECKELVDKMKAGKSVL